MFRSKALFFGLSTIDCIYLVDRPPGRNEKIAAARQLMCAGGPASNAAITFSALGGRATLISCLGSHPLSSVARGELNRYGIDHIDLCPDFFSIPTVSSILVSKENGDRSVVSVPSTHFGNQHFSIKAISLHGYDAVLFDGQYMELATRFARQCRRAGIHTILDGGSWKAGTGELIRHIDTVICSSNFMPPGITVPEKILAWFDDQGVSRAAITQGSRPILAAESGKRFEVLPPRISPVLDTLAAGDIFHGAYVYYESRNPAGTFSGHLQKAAAVAARSCTHFGPRKWTDGMDLKK
jgi:sugar/nucleoside kinase (ribokinase family)